MRQNCFSEKTHSGEELQMKSYNKTLLLIHKKMGSGFLGSPPKEMGVFSWCFIHFMSSGESKVPGYSR